MGTEKSSDTEAWLDKRAAADRLKVSVRTIERLQAEGQITGYRVHGWMVRYKKSELDAYMERQKIEGTPTEQRISSGHKRERQT